MDRQAFTTGQLVPNAQLLGMEKGKLVALGYALEAIMGAGGTVVSGLACAPTTTPSLSVVIGRGSIMTTTAIDAVAYSDLGTDSNATIKQGILQEPGVTLTLTAPATPGYSQVYLIQAAQGDVDSSTVVPFYNASNPAQPYNGPNNSGNGTLVLRQSKCVVSLKAGAAASSGSQTTPPPDVGNVGLYTITLVNGQTQITAGQIVQLASAPFVPVTLPQVPAGVQSGQWLYSADTGSSGALIAALAPTPTALPDGMEIHVKAANAAAGSDTINVAGLGALPIRRRGGGLAPAAKDWSAGDILTLRKVGSVWQVASLLPSDVLAIITGSGTVPIILQSPTIYVRTDGNDTTGDGSANTAAKAFATIAAAATYARNKYYLAAVTLTIQLGNAGTYAPTGSIDAGGGTINIVGDVNNAANYIIQGSGPSGGASGLIASIHGTVNLSGVTLTNTGTNNSCAAATGTGSMSLTSVIFNTNVSGSPALISAFAGGVVTIFGGCVLNGYANAALFMSSGYITMAGNINLTNTPVYATAFCVAQNCGVFTLSGSYTFTGTTATCPRYLATTNSVIGTNGSGANFFPGNSAGSTATGAQYG